MTERARVWRRNQVAVPAPTSTARATRRTPGTRTAQVGWTPRSGSSRPPMPMGNQIEATRAVAAAAAAAVRAVGVWTSRDVALTVRRVMPIAESVGRSSAAADADWRTAWPTSTSPASRITAARTFSAVRSTVVVVPTRRAASWRSSTGVPGATTSSTERCSAAMSAAPLRSCTSAFSTRRASSPCSAAKPGDRKACPSGRNRNWARVLTRPTISTSRWTPEAGPLNGSSSGA